MFSSKNNRKRYKIINDVLLFVTNSKIISQEFLKIVKKVRSYYRKLCINSTTTKINKSVCVSFSSNYNSHYEVITTS